MQSSLLYGLLHMQKLKMVSKIPPPMQRLCMHVLRTLAHSRSESVSERHFSGAVQRQLLGCTSTSIAHIAEATAVHIANGNCCHDFGNLAVMFDFSNVPVLCFRGLAAYPAGYAAAQGGRLFANARNKGLNDLERFCALLQSTL